MSPAPPRPIAELLAYLRELGFEELYRRSAAAPGGGEEEPAGAVPSGSAPSGAAADTAARRASLGGLESEASTCRRCRLAEGRRKVVFGCGDPDAELMFIGEAPGAEEDRQGLPFVGPAGALLTRMIRAMERERHEVYIANIVKCRPPGNRDPQPDEAAACRSYLDAQIDLVRPRVIVALGRVAAQALLGNDIAIGQLRGKWYRVRGVPTMVTYHPAALLRNAALKRPTWEDLKQVLEHLGDAASGPAPPG